MKLFQAISLIIFSIFAMQSNAAINPGTDYDQGGELIFSVWDHATSTSYTLDLGINTRNFDGNGTYTYDLSSDENWEYFKARTYDLYPNSIEWNVAGSDRDNRIPSTNGIMTTERIDENIPYSVTDISLGAFQFFQQELEEYQHFLDGNSIDYAKNHSYFLEGRDYTGLTENWGAWGGNLGDLTTAGYGESMEFWSLTTGGTWYRDKHAIHEKLAGTWTLANNQLLYTAAAPVPVPAAVWLFGSALAGLVGVSRRKRS